MSDSPIHTFAKWQVSEGQTETVLELLAELAKKSNAEKGNLFYKAFRSNTDSDTIILYEAYADEASIQAHRNSAHYQTAIEHIIPLLKSREVTLTTPLTFS